MNLKIGVNNFNKATLKELNKLVTPQFKIDFKEKKDNFLSEPEIFEAFIMGLSANVAWDMIKALFNILQKQKIKMNPIKTDLDKIGIIYFEDSASNITIIIQGDNSALISNKKSSKKLKINENFEVIEVDKK